MKRLEAKEYVERAQGLAEVHANKLVDTRNYPYLKEVGIKVEIGEILSEDQSKKVAVFLAELEEQLLDEIPQLISDGDLYIIRNDGEGPSEDPKRVAFNTVVKVERVETRDTEKILDTPDGLVKVPAKTYIAYGERHEQGQDSCSSGPEGFIKVGKSWRQYGAVTALIARLLEARAEGVV